MIRAFSVLSLSLSLFPALPLSHTLLAVLLLPPLSIPLTFKSIQLKHFTGTSCTGRSSHLSFPLTFAHSLTHVEAFRTTTKVTLVTIKRNPPSSLRSPAHIESNAPMLPPILPTQAPPPPPRPPSRPLLTASSVGEFRAADWAAESKVGFVASPVAGFIDDAVDAVDAVGVVVGVVGVIGVTRWLHFFFMG